MIKIRNANAADIPALETLFLLTRKKNFHWENPDKFQIEDFRQSTAGETILVAEDREVIVAFVSIWTEDPIPFIHNLFVAPSHQKKGIGQLLIQSLLTRWPPPYRLKCVAKNQNALAFYQKQGWVKIGEGVGEEGEYLLLEFSQGVKNKGEIKEC